MEIRDGAKAIPAHLCAVHTFSAYGDAFVDPNV
jgi:hypothetical protein